jgi:hypothetical protein
MPPRAAANRQFETRPRRVAGDATPDNRSQPGSPAVDTVEQADVKQ